MRTSVLTLAMLALPLTAAADDKQDFSKVQIKATKVAGQIYVIEDVVPEFSGGNVGVSAGPDGILLIDDKFAAIAPKLEAALKTVSDKPVKFVINTHYHGDHSDGNSVLGPKSTIIASDNTRKRMMTPQGKEPPPPAAALPVLTFEHKLSVHFNGEEIRATHYPSGHTDTDVIVVFPKSNVVHMGDDFFNGMYPFIDLDGGGSVKGLIANLVQVIPQIPAGAKIIPGHGPIATIKELRDYLAMLQGTTAIVEAGIKARKTADQLKKEKALARYDAWGKGFLKPDDFIDQLYKELSKH